MGVENPENPLSDSAGSPKSAVLRRTLAILLSILDAGPGHVAMGYPKRGAKWFASALLLYAAFVGSIASGALVSGCLFFGLLVCLRIAAIRDTARINVPATAPFSLIAVILFGMIVASYMAGVVGIQFARAYRMPTPSMYPSLEVGDRFLSSRILGNLQRGQVIVFNYPRDRTKSYVQRLVGLPGDTIEMRRGELIVNGKLINKDPLSDSCGTLEMECTIWKETIDGNTHKIAMVKEEYLFDPRSREFGPVTVPAGQLFVLGDNRDNSADSRYWGYLPIELVRAKPKVIYWSSGDTGIRWNRISKIVQ